MLESGRWFEPNRERLNPRAKKSSVKGDANDMQPQDQDDAMSDFSREDQDGDNSDKPEIRTLDGDVQSHNSPDVGNNDTRTLISEGEDDELFINVPLETLFAQNKPDDIDAEESEVIISLIRRMLRYDPAGRPSAAELLKEE